MKWARIFIYLLVAVVGLEAVWLFAANRYLQSQHFREILQKDGNQITYESAFTSAPGYLKIKGFTLQNEETLIELPELRLQFSLVGLAGRKIMFWSARGKGGQVRFIPASSTASSESKADTSTSEKEAAADSNPDSADSSWSVHFQKMVFKNLNKLTVGSFQAHGDIDFEATLHIAADDTIHIPNGRIRIRETQTQWKDQNIALIQNLQGRFQLDPFRDDDNFLRKLSFDVSGGAELQEGPALQKFLVDAPWLRIHGLKLVSNGRLVMDKGQLAPRTRFEVKTQNLQLEFWKENFVGDGSFQLSVDQLLKLDVSLPTFKVNHKKEGPAEIQGSGLTLHLQTEDRDILSRDRKWQAAFRLQTAKVRDLSAFNHFFPQGLGFQFKSGEADLYVNLDSRVTTGNVIALDSRNARVAYDKQEFFGRIKQDFRIGTIDFEQEGFTIPSGDIALQVKQGGPDSKEADWKGQISLTEGRVEVRSPARFEGNLAIKAQDLRPVLWFYDPKNKLPDWARKLFRQESLGAHFHLKADENSYAVEDLKAETPDLKLEAWLQGTGSKKRGKLFIRYGSLSAGIGVNDDDFKVQLLSARDWFKDRG